MNDRLEDIQFKYLFIKEFKWSSPHLTEKHGGHPKIGEVYRSMYNSEIGTYKIMLDDEIGLVFHNLTNANDESDHKCNMIELTKSNILNYDLSEESLDKMIKWIDNDNNDLKKFFQHPISKGLQSLQIAIKQQGADEQKAMAEASGVLKGLFIINTDLFNLVIEIADKLGEFTLAREDCAVTPIALGREGKGYNIASAVDCIDTYLEPVKKGGDRREELLEAIISLYQELERRERLELDEE